MISTVTYRLLIIIISVGLATSCHMIPGSKSKNGPGEGYYENLSKYRPKLPPDTTDADSSLGTHTEDKGDTKTTAPNPTSPKGGMNTETQGFAQEITSSLDAKMDSISLLSQEIDRVDGYAIQVYTGTNERQATMAKGRVVDLMPKADVSYNYEALNFKVRVGKYFDRLEAQRDYALLKKSFPNAIIVMRKFTIER